MGLAVAPDNNERETFFSCFATNCSARVSQFHVHGSVNVLGRKQAVLELRQKRVALRLGLRQQVVVNSTLVDDDAYT